MTAATEPGPLCHTIRSSCSRRISWHTNCSGFAMVVHLTVEVRGHALALVVLGLGMLVEHSDAWVVARTRTRAAVSAAACEPGPS
jgi:hypothetical protein